LVPAVYLAQQLIIYILLVGDPLRSPHSGFTDDGAEFTTWYTVAEALNLADLILLSFLLASFICLPAEKTRRHYLSYCLVVGGMLMAVGILTCTLLSTKLTLGKLAFVVPFGAKPSQCYDEITPNDMYSSLTCAFSGAFLISGGLSIAVWSRCPAGRHRALLTSM
jgi:hypothetical protein